MILIYRVFNVLDQSETDAAVQTRLLFKLIFGPKHKDIQLMIKKTEKKKILTSVKLEPENVKTINQW